ncbi:MAG TPA: NADH-quinone oxidoreductase subunit J [Candidatus Bathyarchaeia archaeon]
MIFEVLSAGLVISACLAIFLDEAVYSVAALANTLVFMALLYVFTDALFVAIFQFAVGVGTLAVLFLSGEMLSEKPAKTPRKNVLAIIMAGALLSLPAIFLSISGSTSVVGGVTFEEALWNLRAVDVVLQGLVVMAVALGIGIVLHEKRKGAK